MGKWILMIVLGIIALLLALLAVFCFGKLKIHAVYRKDGSCFEVGTLFLTFPLYPKKEKKKKKEKKSKKRKKTAKSAPETPEKGEEQAARPDIPALLRFALEILRGIPFEKTETELREFRVTVASGDAAKTALLYSGAIQLTAALFALLEKSRKFVILTEDAVSVTPDFLSEKSSFSMDVVFRMRTGPLLQGLLRSLWRQITRNGGFSFTKTASSGRRGKQADAADLGR